ncbi:cell wall hydrolase [Tenuibacillus multivorans]|uniref:N-acetylmuramoyl-L-alanine amidase n=1 Tax=Tenuibacillus multivorans TaxID=237069 RepID=A0A1G9WYB0_9BACI|nr:cell wall hydrolase [Tenuibacillus multivorans]GEL77309.1 cell wall hydrolase [Tenuibacillus multivorans]SDM89281.1 N-acetylmuramoyl-L-alanine amidase [Tenuibacillus multivorans]
MAVIAYNEAQLKQLARLMRAEAEGDGQLGMLLVGNVGVNRVIVECLDFENIDSLPDMIFQSPGGFEAVQESYFYQRARDQDIRLARRVTAGQEFEPGDDSLWFFRPSGDCPAQWFGQWNSGRYKSHCYFTPTQGECPSLF